MLTIKDFIDAGFWTVPLKGTLERKKDGSKTIPKFPKDYIVKYTKKFNVTDSDLGLLLTGNKTNVLAIDCDNEETLNMFLSLDKENKAVTLSKGKPKGGGTILYRLRDGTKNININSFRTHNSIIDLDIYSDGGAIYAPTVGNKTKEQWETIPELKLVPQKVIDFIEYIRGKQETPSQIKEVNTDTYIHLAPMVNEFCVSQEYSSLLWKKLTPKDYRNEPKFKKKGFITPNDISSGGRSNYLSKVSAILGKDESINSNLYITAIELINANLNPPMDSNRLLSTIIEPMLKGSAKINGKSIWRYNKDWQSTKLLIQTKNGESLFILYDSHRFAYYAINLQTEHVRMFMKETDLVNFLNVTARKPVNRQTLQKKIDIIRVKSTPKFNFGFYKQEDETFFNNFRRSQALNILDNPELHDKFKYPTFTIKYLQSLIPEEKTFNYVLRFLRTKLTTFKYSPVVLYFLGQPGSGKDLFVSWIAKIVSEDSIARPSVKEFLEQYNSWMVDKYFIQLDEYGDKISKQHEKMEVLGQIKTYTGSEIIQIRPMRQTGYNYRHNITFIMTANRNPLILDEADRRVCVINTPNILAKQDFVIQLGGTDELVNRLWAEINDFAYYLATEYENLASIDYMNAYINSAKRNTIVSMLSGGAKIAYLLSNRMFEELEQMANNYDVTGLFIEGGFIDDTALFEIYYELTNGQGTSKGLGYYLRNSGFIKKPYKSAGATHYKWEVPGLAEYQPNNFLFQE